MKLVPTLFALMTLLFLGSASAQNQVPGVTDEQIDSAPVLGQVIAYNPTLGFAITNAGSLKGVKKGVRLAVIQQGVIVAIGWVEEVNADTSTIDFPNQRAYPSPVLRPKIRDRVILFPPRSK